MAKPHKSQAVLVAVILISILGIIHGCSVLITRPNGL